MNNDQNPDELLTGSVDAIAGLAKKATEVRNLADSKVLIAVPDGISIIDQDTLHDPEGDSSRRIERIEKLSTVNSFVEYILAYGSSSTAIFLNESDCSATAIMNYIPESKEERNAIRNFRFDWTATLELEFSEQYNLLMQISKSKVEPVAVKQAILNLSDYILNTQINISGDSSSDKSFSNLNEYELMANLLDVTLVSEQELIEILYENKKSPLRFLIYIGIPIFYGDKAISVPILIDKSEAVWSMKVCNSENVELTFRKESIENLKNEITGEYPLFCAGKSLKK